MLTNALRAAFLAVPFVLAACGGASSESGEASNKPAGGQKSMIDNETGAAAEMVMGADDAPVTVIEYASVTCPHCADFHEDVFPALKEKYIDTGKVKFVFREFPTAPQMLSLAGSMIARCAAEKSGPDAYFVVLDALFKTQRTWISESAKSELTKIASQAGMDESAFNACLARQDLADVIDRRVREAQDQFSISATPSFVIDGKVEQVRTVEDFETRLDAALKKASG